MEERNWQVELRDGQRCEEQTSGGFGLIGREERKDCCRREIGRWGLGMGIEVRNVHLEQRDGVVQNRKWAGEGEKRTVETVSLVGFINNFFGDCRFFLGLDWGCSRSVEIVRSSMTSVSAP